MKERPLLMCSEMVRAVLAGRKRQTRRVITPQPYESGGGLFWTGKNFTYEITPGSDIDRCPHGKRGDHLWIKERGWMAPSKTAACHYVGNEAHEKNPPHDPDGRPYKSYPSIFMPRWCCRIRLEITQVRVERIQDITPDDCRAEGMPEHNNDIGVRYAYGQLWNQLNEKRGFGWAKNPWVWAISFKALDDQTGKPLELRNFLATTPTTLTMKP